MKSFLKILLTIYFVIVTAAAGIFGYSYFTGKKLAFVDNTVNLIENKLKEGKTNEGKTEEGSMSMDQFQLILNNYLKLSNPNGDAVVISTEVESIAYSNISDYFNGKNDFTTSEYESFDGQSYYKYKHGEPDPNAGSVTIATKSEGLKGQDLKNYNSENLYFLRLTASKFDQIFTNVLKLNNETDPTLGIDAMKLAIAVDENCVLLKFCTFISDGRYMNEYLSLVYDEHSNITKIIFAADNIYGTTIVDAITGESTTTEERVFAYKMYNIAQDKTYVLEGESATILSELDSYRSADAVNKNIFDLVD